jgi:hypothetical protein
MDHLEKKRYGPTADSGIPPVTDPKEAEVTKPAQVNHGTCSVCGLRVGRRYKSPGPTNLCVALPHAIADPPATVKTDSWLFADDKDTDKRETSEDADDLPHLW